MSDDDDQAVIDTEIRQLYGVGTTRDVLEAMYQPEDVARIIAEVELEKDNGKSDEIENENMSPPTVDTLGADDDSSAENSGKELHGVEDEGEHVKLKNDALSDKEKEDFEGLAEEQRLEEERAEAESLEKERLAEDDAEKERTEKEDADRLENARLAAEAAEKELLEREEAQRVAAEAAEKEQLEKEEAERLAAEVAEKEQQAEKLEAEAAEKEQLEKEVAEKERLEKEEAERLAAEAAEKERLEEKERLAAEAAEKDRLEEEAAEKERLEKQEAERLEAEAEAAEKENLEKEAAEKEQLQKEEAEMLEAEAAEKERLEEEGAQMDDAERFKNEKQIEAEEQAAEELLEAQLAAATVDDDISDMSEPKAENGGRDDDDKLVEEIQHEMETLGQNGGTEKSEQGEMVIAFSEEGEGGGDLRTPPTSSRTTNVSISGAHKHSSNRKSPKVKINVKPTTPPRIPRVAMLASPSSKNRDQQVQSPKSRIPRSPPRSPSSFPVSSLPPTPIRKTLPRVLSPRDAPGCPTEYNPYLHGSKGPCERCLFWASDEEKDIFQSTGHHIRIMVCQGGCDRSCLVYPREESQPPVRLCKKCYFDTHRTKYDLVTSPLKDVVP